MSQIKTQKKTIEIPDSVIKEIKDLTKGEASYKEINFSEFTRIAIKEKLEREKKGKK